MHTKVGCSVDMVGIFDENVSIGISPSADEQRFGRRMRLDAPNLPKVTGPHLGDDFDKSFDGQKLSIDGRL